MSKKRIGILTGGGDCPGLNAAIRGITKLILNDGEYEVIGFRDGYKGLVLGDFIVLDNKTVSDILTIGGTILGTSNKANPYQWFEKNENGEIVSKDRSKEAIRVYKDLNLEYLIVIGGDGTFAIGKKLHEDGLKIIGIPKTIDNDLKGTEFTIGFKTAVNTITMIAEKLKSTAESHHRIMIAETMGRYAGWLALYSGTSIGADAILIPEIPFNIEKIAEEIKNRIKKGKRYSLIIVSEGAKPSGGEMFVRKIIKDSPDPIRLGGISLKIADDLEDILQIPARATIIGHSQRGGEPVFEDRILASLFSYHAFLRVKKGVHGVLVGLSHGKIVEVPLEIAGSGPRLVPKDHELIKFEKGIGTIFGE